VSRIVCNAGPLIALGILGRLELLQSLFDEVLVPEAVQREIVQGGVKIAGLEHFQRPIVNELHANMGPRRI
jgi:predicted nucleic acid-binding protein